LQPDSLLLDNPVWRKPLINLGRGSFFCALPQTFFSFIFPVINDLVAEDSSLKRAYDHRRAKFLEIEIARTFSNAFPGAEIVTGFQWRDGEQKFENDLLIRMDSHLLLVEAKSGAISWPALRGAPDRARRHIEDLLYAPSAQSARLADRIRAVVKAPELRDSLLPNLDLRLDLVRTVLRLSVTLENFAAIQSNTQILKMTGWIPKGHKLAPCITLADLNVIFDILEPPGQKVYYLRRRAELEEQMEYLGDELDLLGFYLATGFNIEGTEAEGVGLNIVGMSSRVDKYFIARAEGIICPKPRLRLSKWWTDICSKIEARNFHQWTEVSNILLGVPLQAQENAYKIFRKLATSVRRNGGGHNDTAFLAPSKFKSDALVLYAFPEYQKDYRYERIHRLASQAFTHPQIERCLVLALDSKKHNYPYGTLAVLFKGEDLGKNLIVY